MRLEENRGGDHRAEHCAKADESGSAGYRPAFARVLGLAPSAQVGRQGGALSGPAIDRRRGQADSWQDQQRGQKRHRAYTSQRCRSDQRE